MREFGVSEGGGAQHALPGDDEELGLWRRYAKTRDASVREHLIERHLPLCRSIAATLYRKRIADDAEFTDYMQYATLGLIEAVDSFDCTRGVRFNTFATYRIQGAIRNNIAKFSERREQACWLYRLKKDHPIDDTAAFAALSFFLEDCGLLTTEYNSQYVEHFYERLELRRFEDRLAAMVETLPPQERQVISSHYFENLAFTQIARLLALSKGRISQIHKNALASLQARACRAS